MLNFVSDRAAIDSSALAMRSACSTAAINSGLFSSTIAALYWPDISKTSRCTLSDAASKPLFIAGPHDWQDAARRLGITQAIRIDADGRIAVTAALHRRLNFLGPAPDLDIVP